MNTNTKNSFITFSIGFILLFKILGCNNDSTFARPCDGFDAGVLNSSDGNVKNKLEKVFLASVSSNLDTLLKELPQGFSRYAKAFDSRWALRCLKVKRVVSDTAFMYCLYESVEIFNTHELAGEGVIFFYMKDGKWELANFPFHRSGLPEFGQTPVWGSQ